ncbi:MAG: heat-inducible transcription repressor HrcA [Proteobacteria bacterium]|nr:heat-inducible transcription repressor HrcA [Pseudomonadota bacterium]
MTPGPTKRHLEILEILISDYIASAQPVGSRTIARQHHGHLSPATVRNIMADLTDLGLLAQPHVSAGRLPTALGMRVFVETLLKRRDLSETEMHEIRRRCAGDERRMDAVLSRTSRMLAAVSRYAGMVVTPDAGRIKFRHMEFVPLSGRRLLGIFVSQDGSVQNRLIEVGEDYSYPDIERINNYCNRSFLGLSLEDALEKARTEHAAAREEYDRLLSGAMALSEELLSAIPGIDLVVDGEMQLLAEPEFAKAEDFRRIVEALEEKSSMLGLLERCRDGQGVRIFIGSEAHIEGVDSVGIVGAPYLKDGKVVGAIGVIGPMRMDYSRVVPIVDFTAKVLSDVLDS